MSLTPNAIPHVVNRTPIECVVQILRCAHVDHDEHDNLFELDISDGKYVTTVIFLKPSHLVLSQFAVVKVLGFTVVSDRVVLVQEIEPLAKKPQIGNPQRVEIGDDMKIEVDVKPNVTNVAAPPPQRSVNPNSSAHQIDLLTTYDENWFVIARLMTKGDIKTMSKGDKQFQIMNCDFGDRSGEMRATLYDESINAYNNILEQGLCYKISGAKIKCVQKKYSSIPREYEMQFSSKTTIESVPDDPSIPLRFDYPCDILQVLDLPKDEIIDFIGVVDRVDDAAPVGQKGTLKKNVYLADDTNRTIELTLWGKSTQMNFPTKEVIIFKNLKVNEWNGSKSLVYSFSSTYTVVSPSDINTITGADRIFQWLGKGTESRLENVSKPNRSASNSSNPNDWKTIQEAIDEDLGRDEDAYFWCTASISTIKNQDGTKIFYSSCPNKEKKCLKGVTEENGSYYCSKCAQHYQEFLPRYMLQFSIADHSGYVWVRCFGEDGEKVMKHPCPEVVKLGESESTKTEYESIFLNSKYQKFNFKIKCSPPYGESTYISYTVQSIGAFNPGNSAKRKARVLEETLNASA